LATNRIQTVIDELRRAMLVQDGTALTDQALLTSFIDQQDQAAFAALVRRHGPMVWGVCRRTLASHHDAEDAFQATFLVLVRKAASIVPRERVAHWLYGVASTTAHRAKVATARRRARERLVAQMPEPEAVPQGLGDDLRSLLDRELSLLPEKYRLPIILCDLEGQTIQAGARQLGWRQGTLAGRLARGRQMLARRLTRRGALFSAGLLAAVLLESAASAGVPRALLTATIQAGQLLATGQATAAGAISAQAIVLMEGVIKAMLVTKLKTVAALLFVLAAIGIGGSMFSRSTTAAAQAPEDRLRLVRSEGPTTRAQPEKDVLVSVQEDRTGSLIFGVGINSDAGLTGSLVVKDEKKERTVLPDRLSLNDFLYWVGFVDSGTVPEKKPAGKKTAFATADLDRLQGVWWVVSIENDGKPAKLEKIVFMVDGKRVCWQTKDFEAQGGLYLDTTAEPRAFDLATSTGTMEGIYSVDGDKLRMCFVPGNNGTEPKRPTRFATEPGSRQVLFVLKRAFGKEAFPFRLQDGTRAFPTLIERTRKGPPPPPPKLLDPAASPPSSPYSVPTDGEPGRHRPRAR
jgi:RNA polymerase sigma factor (sigma-70 family)